MAEDACDVHILLTLDEKKISSLYAACDVDAFLQVKTRHETRHIIG